MNARFRLALLTAAAATVVLVSCLNAPPGPASATLDMPPTFRPPMVATDGGNADAGARDGGTSDGGTMPMGDAGVTDGGGMGAVDAGPQGLVVISKMHKLPPAWVVTDPTQLNRLQAIDAGSEGIKRVGSLVRFATPSTSDNTAATPDKCPNIFSGMCSGFAATVTGATNPVLVDNFALLGAARMDCADKFNGASLPSISGVWQGRFTSATNETAYSIALTSCAGVGVGAEYVGNIEAPASFDVQRMQASYARDGRVIVVRGVVTAVSAPSGTAMRIQNIYLQDPVGGPFSGIGVRYPPGFTAQPTDAGTVDAGTAFVQLPAVGDYVQVTAKASNFGDANQLLIEP